MSNYHYPLMNSSYAGGALSLMIVLGLTFTVLVPLLRLIAVRGRRYAKLSLMLISLSLAFNSAALVGSAAINVPTAIRVLIALGLALDFVIVAVAAIFVGVAVVMFGQR